MSLHLTTAREELLTAEEPDLWILIDDLGDIATARGMVTEGVHFSPFDRDCKPHTVRHSTGEPQYGLGKMQLSAGDSLTFTLDLTVGPEDSP